MKLFREDMELNVKIGEIEIGKGKPFFVIAGPCSLESWDLIYNTGRALKDVARELGFAYVFKTSFDKANRTSIHSFRGPGMESGLEMLAELKRKLDVPIISDVHESHQCAAAAEVLDILQIPAFLCRQTDLLMAAARTGKCVSIKKGQFLSPQEVENSIIKVTQEGNENVFITERGTTFGYNNLVVDMRGIPIMQQFGKPVIFDATHSVQLPGASGTSTNGQRQFVPTLAKAAVAAGCDGLFMEVHPDPDHAMSDGPNQVPLAQFKELMTHVMKVHQVVSSLPELDLPAYGKCPALVF
jgi:2-dehydro-3-deoxyphosphooctonate aldolase (KDO 8-P synthase)